MEKDQDKPNTSDQPSEAGANHQPLSSAGRWRMANPDQAINDGDINRPLSSTERCRILYAGAYNPEHSRIGDKYSEVASIYAKEWANGEAVRYKNNQEIKKIFDSLHIGTGSILDLGCGPGNLKDVLGDQFWYMGADVSPEMCRQAEHNGYKSVYNHSLETALYATPDNCVDYVVASSVLYFIKPEHIPRMLKEMERVARRGIIFTVEDVTPVAEPLKEVTGLTLHDHSHIDVDKILGEWKTDPATDQEIVAIGFDMTVPEAWHSPTIEKQFSRKAAVDARIVARFYDDARYAMWSPIQEANDKLYKNIQSKFAGMSPEEISAAAKDMWPQPDDQEEK